MMNMNLIYTWLKAVIVLLLFTAVIPLCAQNKIDTASINKQISQAKIYLYTHPDSTEIILKDVQRKSENINYSFGLFKVRHFRGNIALMSGQYDEALKQYGIAEKYIDKNTEHENYASILGNRGLVYSLLYKSDSALLYYNQALDIAKTYHLNKLIQKFTMDIGNIYNRKSDFINAIDYLSQAIGIAEMMKDTTALANMYFSYGLLYYQLMKYNKSLYYYRRVLQLNKTIANIDFRAKVFINIGQVYDNMQLWDSALFYYNQAINVALPFEKERIQVSAKLNIGNIFTSRKDYDSAIYYYNEVYQNADLINNPDIYAAVVVNLGTAYFDNNNLKEARPFLIRSNRITDSLQMPEYKMKVLRQLIKLAKIDKNFKLALDYTEKYMVLYEQQNAESAAHQLAILEFDKEVARKQYDHEVLLKESEYKSQLISIQRNLLWLSIGALLIVGLLLYIALKNRKKIKHLHTDLSHQHEKLLHSNIALEQQQEELKQQKEALNASNVAKDKFFSILAHDLKGPVSGINELLSILSMQWTDIEESEKLNLMKLLTNSSSKTLKLLEDMLLWGKASQGGLKATYEEFELLPLVNGIIQLYTSTTNQKQINIITNIPESYALNSDPNFVGHIVQNFINNAIKFSHPGSTVTVALLENGNRTKICVSDKGIGIPDEKIKHIFEADADFNRPGTQNEKSTGMGLMLCSEYARLLNASLSVRSVVNQGSTFCLELIKKNK